MIAAPFYYSAVVGLLFVAAVGHAAIWVALINYIHASGWKQSFINRLNKLLFLCLLVPPPAAACWLLWVHFDLLALMPWRMFAATGPHNLGLLAFECYICVCWLSAAATVVQRLRWMVQHDASSILRFHRSRSLGASSREQGAGRFPQGTGAGAPLSYSLLSAPGSMLVRLPGNESLEVDLTERGLDVPRLPPPLDGLSIVHLSDFHFTGKVGKPFFDEIVRMSNELEPEVIALTGDFVDKSQFIDWIPDTLGRLKARYGVYYILGNHDRKVDWKRLRSVMDGCGMIYVGGCWKVVEFRGQRVLMAGNEAPWFTPPADLATCPPRSEVPFRFLLSHSPDQLEWGRRGDGDLMLAGHTHGGQIRLPMIGPVFAPSRDGVQFASGLFHAPPTILNVSRGLSAEIPLRMNCTPEIIHLTLHAPSSIPASPRR